MPNTIVASSRPICGLQKQFWPGHAASVLYCPMMNWPPSVPMTVQSASPKIHVKENHAPHTTTASDTTVIAALYHVPNRLA